MKLHIPTRLRASLLAAVLAVPFMIYNGLAQTNVTSNNGTYDTNVATTYGTVSGNGNTFNQTGESITFNLISGRLNEVNADNANVAITELRGANNLVRVTGTGTVQIGTISTAVTNLRILAQGNSVTLGSSFGGFMSLLSANATVTGDFVLWQNSVAIATNELSVSGNLTFDNGTSVTTNLINAAGAGTRFGIFASDIVTIQTSGGATGAVNVNQFYLGESASLTATTSDINAVHINWQSNATLDIGTQTLTLTGADAVNLSDGVSLTGNLNAVSHVNIGNSVTITGDVKTTQNIAVADGISNIVGDASALDVSVTNGSLGVDGMLVATGDVELNSDGNLSVTGALSAASLNMDTNSTLDAASVTLTGDLIVTNSTISSSVTMRGVLNLFGADVDGVSGFTGAAVVTNSSTGALTGNNASSLSIASGSAWGGLASTGSITGVVDLSIERATVTGFINITGNLNTKIGTEIKGNIMNAVNITMEDTTVTGETSLTGILTMSQSNAGDISGFIDGSTISSSVANGLTGNASTLSILSGSQVGTIDGVTDLTVDNSAVLGTATITGALNASGNATTMAIVMGATTADVTQGAVVGDITMTDALTVSAATVGDVTGATSATLTNAAVAGDLAMDSTVNPANVVLEGASTAGQITGATDVTLDASSVDGAVAMQGELTMNNSATIVGAVTGATNVKINNSTINDTLELTGTLSVVNSTVSGAVSGFTTAVLTDAHVGAMTGMGTGSSITASSTVIGGSVADVATLNFTGGAIQGDIGAVGAAINNVTLTDTNVTGSITAGALITFGNISTGAITADSLTVNNGDINAGAFDVTVAGNIYINNGTITTTGNISGADTILINVLGSVADIVTTGNYDLTSGSIDVAGTATVGNALNLKDGASMTVVGATTVTALTSLLNNSILETESLVTLGLTMANGSLLTTTTATLGGAALNMDGSVIYGDVAESGRAELVDSSLHGSLDMDGDNLLMTNSSVEQVLGTVNNATLSNSSITAGGITANSNLVYEGGAGTIGGDIQAAFVRVDGGSDLSVVGAVNSNAGIAIDESSSLDANSLSAGGNLNVLGGSDVTIAGDVTMTAAARLNLNDGTLKATNAILNGSSLNMSKGALLDALVMGAGDVFLYNTSVALQGIEMTGDLLVNNSTVASVSGFAGATLSGATAGNLTGAGTGSSLTATNLSTMGNLVDVESLTLTDSKANNISGFLTATLDNAQVGQLTGMLDAAGDAISNITASNGSSMGAVSNVLNVTLTNSSALGAIGMAGDLVMTNSSTVGAITGFSSATLNNAVVRSITGNGTANLLATNGSSLGVVAGVANVTLTGSAAVSSITMTGTLSLTDSTVAAFITNFTGAATLDNAQVGNLTGNNADSLTAINGSSMGAVSGVGNVSLTDSSATGLIEMTGVLDLTNSTAANISGFTGAATLDNAQVGNLTGNNADSLTATNGSSMSDVSGVASVTLTSSDAGMISGFTTATLTSAEVGGLTGAGAGSSITAINTNVTGDVASVDTLNFTYGSISGTIGATAAVANVTLTETTVKGAITAGNLATNGNVFTAAITADSLTVNTGILNAGSFDITVDALTLNNGSITTTGSLTVNGDATVDGSSVNVGDLTIDGLYTIKNNSTVTANSLNAQGLSMLSDSVLTATTIDLNNMGLSMDDATLTGAVSNAGEVNTSQAIITADIAGATNATMIATDMSGNVLAMNGALSVTDSQIAGVVGTVTAATLNDSTISSDLTTTGNVNTTGGTVNIEGVLTAGADLDVNAATTLLTDGIDANALNVKELSNITVNGGVEVGTGGLKLNASSLKVIGGIIDVEGNVNVASNSSLDGTTTMTGELRVVNSTTKGISGFIGTAYLAGANVGDLQGGMDLTTNTPLASINAVSGSDIQSISGVINVSMDNSSVQEDVQMTGNLIMKNSATIGGFVAGAVDATLTDSEITGRLDLTGALNATNSTIGGSIAGFTTANLLNAHVGALTGAGTASSIVATDTVVNGAVGSVASLSFTRGTIHGSIGSAADVIANVTLTETSVRGDIFAGDLHTYGDVYTGAITADNLWVSNGDIFAGANDVTIAGTTTFNNGSINTTGKFESADTIYTNVDAIIDTLVITGDYNLVSSSLQVAKTADIANALNVLDNADMQVTGDTTVGGLMTVDNESSFNGSTLSSLGLIVTDNSTVTVTSAELGNGGLTLTDSVFTGEVTEAGTVGMTNSTLTGDIEGALDVTMDSSSIDGNLTMNGDLVMTDSYIQSIDPTSTLVSVTMFNSRVDSGLTTGDFTAKGGHIIIAGDLVAGATDINTNTDMSVLGAMTLSGGLSVTENSTLNVTNALTLKGDLVMNAATLTAASVAGAANVTLTDSTVNNDLGMTGVLSLSGSIAQNISGFTGMAIVDDSTAGNLVGNAATALNVRNGSTVGAISGVAALTVDRSTVNGRVSLTGGDLTAMRGAQINGGVGGALNVDLSDVTVTGAITMTGTLLALDSTISDVTDFTGVARITNTAAGNLMGNAATSLSVLAGSTTGAISGVVDLTVDRSTVGGRVSITGNLTALRGSSINGAVEGAINVDLDDADVTGDITMTGVLNMLNATAGNIATFTGATLNNAQVGNLTGNGTANLVASNGSTMGTVTGVADVTLTGSSATGGIDMSGALAATDSTVGGAVTGFTSATLNNATVGALTGVGTSTVVATDSIINGGVTNVASIDFTRGSINGSIGAAGAAIANVTLTETTVTGDIFAGDLVTHGDIYTGEINAVNLWVNNGDIHAGDNNVTITGTTYYNNGSIFTTGEFTTGDAEYVNVDSIVTNRIVNGNYTLDSSSEQVKGFARITGTLNIINNADMYVTGATTVGGKMTVANESSFVGSTLEANGLSVTSNSTVQFNSADLRGNELLMDQGTISGNVTGATKVTMTDSSLLGTLTMNGNLFMTDSTLTAMGTASTVNNATLNNSSITASGLTVVTNVLVEGGHVYIGGDLTANYIKIDGNSDMDVAGAITSATSARIEENSTLNAASFTTTGNVNILGGASVTLTGNMVTNGGDLNLNAGSLTAAIADLQGGNLNLSKGAMLQANVTGAMDVNMFNVSVVSGTIDMIGELFIKDSTAGSITGFTGAELNNADVVNLVGNGTANLIATNGSTLGTVTNVADVTLTDSDASGNIRMAGALSMTNATAGNISSFTGATLDDAQVGTLTGNGTANLVATNGSTMGAVTRVVDVTLTDSSSTGDITMTGALSMVNASAGDVATFTGAALDNSQVGDLTGNGTANLTAVDGSSMGTVTGVADVTLENSSASGDIIMSGVLDATNATITGDTTSFSTAVLTGSNVGALTGAGANSSITAQDTIVNGNVTNVGTLTFTRGSIDGSIGAAGAAIADVTLTETTVTGSITADSLTTFGDIYTGEINATNLWVNNGDIYAGSSDVTITDTTYFQNGSVITTGTFTSGDTKYINVDAIINELVINGNYDLTSSSLLVETTASITGALNVVDNADMQVVGATTVGGLMTVDNESSFEGSTLSSAGLVVTDNSTVTLDTADLNSGGLTLTDSLFTGDITEAGTVGMTNSTLTGDVAGALDVTMDSSTLDGALTMNGALDMVDSYIGSITTGSTVTSATLNNSSIGSGLTITGTLTATGGHINIGGDLSSGAASLTGNTDMNVAGNMTTTGMLSVTEESDLNITGALDVTGGLSMSAGSITAASTELNSGDLTMQLGSVLNSNVTGAANVTASNSAINGSIAMSGILGLTDVTAGDITGFSGATLNDAQVGNLTGNGTANLLASNGSSMGTIANVADVTLLDSSATGNISMRGALDMSNATARDITGFSGATLNDAQVGNLTGNGTANLVATNGSSMGTVASVADVTLTDSSSTGDITMTGALNMTNATAGDIATFTGATLANAQVGDLTGNGTANLIATDGSSMGEVMDVANVSLSASRADGSVTMTGMLSAISDSTITGDVTGATGVVLNASDVGGTITMTGDLNASNGSEIGGSILGANTVTIAHSLVGGSIGASTGARPTTVTLTESAIGGSVDADTLHVFGNVYTGEVTANTLYVTGGTLNAGDQDVTITGTTTLSNGAVVTTGVFDTGTLVLNNTSGTVNELQVNGNFTLFGDSLIVETLANITGSAMITNTANMAVEQTLTVADRLNVLFNSTLTVKDTISSLGLTANNGSIVAATNGLDLNAGGLDLDNARVNGDIDNVGSLLMDNDSTVIGDMNGVTGAVLDNSRVDNVIMTGTNADVFATNDSEFESITGANDITLGQSEVTGDIAGMTGGNLNLTDSSVDRVTGSSITDINMGSSTIGSVTGSTVTGNLTMTDSHITTGGITVGGSVTMGQDSSIDGNVSAGVDVIVKTDSTIAGDITAGRDVEISAGSQTAATGAASVGGNITAGGNVDIAADSTVNGNITAQTGNVNLYENADVNGDIVAESLTTTGDVFTENVTVDNLTVNQGTLNAGSFDVTVAGETILNNGDVKAGNFTTGSLTLVNLSGEMDSLDVATGLTVSGNNNLTINNTVNVGGNFGINEGYDIVIEGGSMLPGTTNSFNIGADLDITTGSSLTVNNGGGSIASDLTVTGSSSMNVNNGALTVGGNITVDNSTLGVSGGITMTDGILNLNTATVDANVTGAGSTVATGNNTIGSLSTGALTVTDADSSLESSGSITANGALDIQGAVTTTQAGDISLTGAGSIDADIVARDGDITLDSGAGKLTISNDTLDADEKRIVDAEQGSINLLGEDITVSDMTLRAAHEIIVGGILNAGEATIFEGQVTGDGTINKTGKDLLDLGTVQMTGTINVMDASRLNLEKGSNVGTLNFDGGTEFIVAGTARESIDGNVIDPDTVFDTSKLGTVTAGDVTIGLDNGIAGSQGTVVAFDMDLAGGMNNIVTDYLKVGSLTVEEEGASISLRQNDGTDEALIDTETYVEIIGSDTDIDTTNGSISEVVDHDFETLNAHAITENGTVKILLSENYKGAEGNQNQESTAGALGSINDKDIKGTVLGNILTALGQTRSEADALRALDSLGGRGLAGLNKLVIEGSMNHLQTLRASQKAVNDGLIMDYDFVTGQTMYPEYNRAISLQFTGGNTNISDDGNGGGYNTSSLGFIIVGAQKVTNSWTLGYDFAYSHETGRSADVDIVSDAFFIDVNATHTSRRLTQYFSLGAAMYGMDTARSIYVDAPGFSVAGRAKGTTTAAMANLSYEASYDFMPRESRHNLIGVAVVDASFGTVNGFAETGFGNAGLDVNYEDIVNITVGAGLRYRFNFVTAGNAGWVTAEALFITNAGNSDLRVTNRFIGGGTGFEQYGPEASRGGLRLNATGNLPITDQWGVFGQATGEFRPDESSFNGSVGVKFTF